MKFSITIPAYKATFFRECIESVLNQSYKDYEVIILNDYSPENIKDIVEECKKLKNGDKIRYYENDKNVGAIDIVDNWNKLLELANGEYIICMGDDDLLTPNCLDEYNNLISDYPGLSIYHARTKIIDEKSKFLNIQEERPEYESVYSMIWHRTFCNRIQFIGDYLFDIKSLRKDGGFYKLPLAWESDCITSYIAASHNGIANTSKITFLYRGSRYSITNSSNWQYKIIGTTGYRDWLRIFLEKTPIDELDTKYHQLLSSKADSLIKKHIKIMFANYFKESPINAYRYWKQNKRNNSLTIKDFVFSIIMAFSLRLNK